MLARQPLGETHALVTILGTDVGLVKARVEGVRRTGARLGASLVTLAESDITLVRGREGWRVVGAELKQQWGRDMTRAARVRAARVLNLLLRLAPHDTFDAAPLRVFVSTLTELTLRDEAWYDAIECRAVLELLSVLGFDDGATPTLEEARRARTELIARVNRGIAISGL